MTYTKTTKEREWEESINRKKNLKLENKYKSCSRSIYTPTPTHQSKENGNNAEGTDKKKQIE
jgi:hypothetical protein